MKKNYIRVTVLFLAVLLCLAMPAYAVTYASDYIDGYNIKVYASGKQIVTDFEVDATGKMTKVGASSIKIYEYPYKDENLVNTKTEYSTGMTATNCYGYGNTIKYTGQSDMDYMVVVTIFARNASGSDSRTETHYVST